MSEEIFLGRGTETDYLYRWMNPARFEVRDDLSVSSLTESLERCFEDDPETRLVSVDFNGTGECVAAQAADAPQEMRDSFTHSDVPSYFEAWVEHDTPGGHTERVQLRFPVGWNGRLLAITGGGNRTNSQWRFDARNDMRSVDIVDAMRNGFAAVNTDAGNQDPRLCDWGWDEETGEIDWELLTNWSYRSDHNAIVVAKKAVEAVYGEKPTYTYMFGTSGGGRQAIASAIHYPGDFDGIWSDGPVINYTKMAPAMIWTVIVGHQLGNPLSIAKLEAFREAVHESVGGSEAFHDMVERVDYDASLAVGRMTDDGPLTERDAEVMQMIWDGPQDAAGTSLWYGFRPGNEFWKAPKTVFPSLNEDGSYGDDLPLIQLIPVGFLGAWTAGEVGFNWKDLTLDRYADLFKEGVVKFKEYDVSDPDLSPLWKSGCRLLLTHGTDDQCIFVDGSFDYYRRVREVVGDGIDEFFRFFPIPGDGHGFFSKCGEGISVASGMEALMKWVEEGDAPEEIPGQHVDPSTQVVDRVSAVHRY